MSTDARYEQAYTSSTLCPTSLRERALAGTGTNHGFSATLPPLIGMDKAVLLGRSFPDGPTEAADKAALLYPRLPAET